MDDFAPYHSLWTIFSEFEFRNKHWLASPLGTLDAPDVESKVEKWSRQISELKVRFHHNAAPLYVTMTLSEQIDAFKDKHDVLALASPAVQNRHWAQLTDIARKRGMISESHELHDQLSSKNF